MKDLFKMVEKDEKHIPAGIILDARFVEGKGGVITLFEYKKTIAQKSSNQIYASLEGREWKGCFEDPNYENKETEPFNRGPIYYMPATFKEFDIIETENGGRFLSKQNAKTVNTAFNTFIHYDEGQTTMYFKKKEKRNLSGYLNEILSRLGVPKKDVSGIVGDIFKKFNYK